MGTIHRVLCLPMTDDKDGWCNKLYVYIAWSLKWFTYLTRAKHCTESKCIVKTDSTEQAIKENLDFQSFPIE